MLANKRFDYIPLGINEPWADLALRSDLNLVAEQNILLHYPMGLYFHVNKHNTVLAQKIEQGMGIAFKDGSYDKLLQQSKMVQETIKFADTATRRTIKLQNIDFTKNTPNSHIRYWLSPKQLIAFLEQAKSEHNLISKNIKKDRN